MKLFVKRLGAWTLITAMLLVCILPGTAQAAISNTSGDRYNIMLVIDGSGSLTSGDKRTDRDGMRYELISELLGILEDDGHYVGGIVFSSGKFYSPTPTDAEMEKSIMLNTGLLSLDDAAPDGRNPKDYVLAQIQEKGVNLDPTGGTDIGTALMVAQRQLQEMHAQNGLECVVFLFTDGITEFSGNPPAVVGKSHENRDNATREMSQNGIRLFSAFLNNNDRLDDSEMKRLVCAANGINESSMEFQYSYVEINTAKDINKASTNFLKFLGYIDPSYQDEIITQNVHDTFVVPGIGVEEMNIRLYSPYGEALPNLTVTITQPDGTVATNVANRISRTFRVYKIINPTPGQWTIDITVPENNMLYYCYTPVISLDVDALVESVPQPQDLRVNMSPTFTCMLAQGGTAVTDPAAYSDYNCTLEVKDVTDPGNAMTYDIQRSTAGSLSHTMLLDTYGTFEVRTVFTCGEIVVASDPIVLDLTNRAPVTLSNAEADLTYGLFQPGSTDVDLTQYVRDDEDGTNLQYTLANTTCSAGAITITGSTLTLENSSIGDGSIIITATDSQGASTALTVNVETTGMTIWFVLGLIVILIIIGVLVLNSYIKKNKNRPDGELVVSFDMILNDKAYAVSLDLDVPGVGTTSKTNLYKLMQNALRNEDQKILPGIFARDVVSYLIPFSNLLNEITVAADIKAKKGKKHGAVSVKRGSKKTVLYNSSADFFLNETSFTVEFKATEEDTPDPFAHDPFAGTGTGSSKANPFDDLDSPFQAPIAAPKQKTTSKTPQDQVPASGDFDLF